MLSNGTSRLSGYPWCLGGKPTGEGQEPVTETLVQTKILTMTQVDLKQVEVRVEVREEVRKEVRVEVRVEVRKEVRVEVREEVRVDFYSTTLN